MADTIDPNIRAFVKALRRGKSAEDALTEYCWARMAVPIDGGDLLCKGDPFKCGARTNLTMSSAMGADAFDEGATDEAIADAFQGGLDLDRERDVIWRVMSKSERPTSGHLMRRLSRESQEVVGALLGYGHACSILMSR